MQIKGWRYYNHAAIPTTALHEDPDTLPIEDGSIWKMDGAPLLARWITEFDCGYETGWWYVIKDTPFDINALKAKRRYEINKGIKNFEVKEIEPIKHVDELYNVQIAAYSAYPPQYRPSVNKQALISSMPNWSNYICIGAFDRESNKLCGYALLSQTSENHVGFDVMKAEPDCEKRGINAALVEGVMRYFNSLLTHGGYICDGARNINHETAFHEYLEKYFGFRKAYCQLHITYKPKVKGIIRLLYPFRKILFSLDRISAIHSINSVLRMEEICRDEETL